MKLDRPRIAIVGTGAVGAYYGGRLAQAGHDVHFLARSDYPAMKSNGLHVQSVDGDFSIPPDHLNVYRDPSDMPKADLVIITLKSTANDQFPKLLPPLDHGQTVYLTLQNGLGNEAALAELFGAERVIGALAFVCINRIGPARIHHMDHGLVRMGEYHRKGVTERLAKLCSLFQQSLIHCQTLEDLAYGRWAKLVWNVPFNGLGAALGLTTDKLINNDAGLSLVTALMAEVIAIARTQGVQFAETLIQEQVDRTRSMGAYRSSMQVDREDGRPLEVEAIVGKPLSVGLSAGLQLPALRQLHTLLQAVDRTALR